MATTEKSTGQSLAATGGHALAPVTSRVLRLASGEQIDTSHLTDEQISELQMLAAQNTLDIYKTAQILKVDIGAMGSVLNTIAEVVKQVSEAGNSATITQSGENALGTYEAIIGNTDTAAKGKLTRSQAGLKDYTLYYLGGGAIVLIVLALILAR